MRSRPTTNGTNLIGLDIYVFIIMLINFWDLTMFKRSPCMILINLAKPTFLLWVKMAMVLYMILKRNNWQSKNYITITNSYVPICLNIEPDQPVKAGLLNVVIKANVLAVFVTVSLGMLEMPVNWMVIYVQGVTVPFFTFQELITQKQSISDPMLVKPKCVWEAYINFDIPAVCLQFSTVCLQFSNVRLLKRILALPTWGQKCIFSEL